MPGDLSYGKSVLIALDQLVNAICQGWPDETISSQSYRWHMQGKRSWPRQLIDAVARIFGDVDHCAESYQSERKRRQFPPELR